MTTKTKAAQRNLPHNTTYKLVRAFHTGGLENACGCENCGKLIVNVAEVKDETGKTFLVGMDCAATLATINPFEFDAAKALFAEAKKVRAAILKNQKEHGEYFSVQLLEFIDTYNHNTPTVAVIGNLAHKPGAPAYMEGRRFTYYYQDEAFAQTIKPAIADLLN